ncbi:glycosyltransferase family 2 protein, partial [Hortaea werneckii]
MCSSRAIEVFYFFYMIINLYIALCTAIESFLGLSPVRNARVTAIKVDEKGGKFPTSEDKLPIMDMVMVAYLPNEKDIVLGQIMYALEEIVYPADKLRVNLVYNTPSPIEPLETKLRNLATEYSQLNIVKVPNSKSKADNLNHFFSLPSTGADFTGIFDTDHLPHPYNVRWAAERFVKDGEKVDIVQGRCVVYNTSEGFLAKMIAVEFDKIYAIAHPGRSRMFQFGLFCGSNGWWRSDVVRNIKMHGHMLTEDIDSALRAYGSGKHAVHDMNVVSYELAPTTFGAFWKQRMRWTQGWTQASVKHMPLVWTNPPDGKRTKAERMGLVSLLFTRELSYYFVSQHTCLLLSFIITEWPTDVPSFVKLIFFRYPMAEWFLFATIAALIATLWFTNKVRSEFTSWKSMVCFSIVFTPYLVLQATMGLFGHARELTKYSNWNPTARKLVFV